ncbi:MAG: ECF-type sigma factor [Phycisphaerales bacterium]|nr:sigma-70 family RNA polymerase sigma factor [Planctomycetota bacterium]
MAGALSVGTILSNAAAGDEGSVQDLLPMVYAELRARAGSYLEGRGPHTLQPTALVHEAFLKMMSSDREWTGRDHFMAVAATAMRQVLVDHARSKNAEKRGGGMVRNGVQIDSASDLGIESLEIVDVDDLLRALAQADARAAKIAEMRLFGGMEHEQIARVLGLSRSVVVNDWQFARAWLAAKMKGGEARRPSVEIPREGSGVSRV